VDDWTTAVYVRELVHQAEAAQLAAHEFNASLKSPGANGTARAFAAVQSLLAAAAMVSKMLWPNPQQVQIRWLAVEGGGGGPAQDHLGPRENP